MGPIPASIDRKLMSEVSQSEQMIVLFFGVATAETFCFKKLIKSI
jgi:hypothetical protein